MALPMTVSSNMHGVRGVIQPSVTPTLGSGRWKNNGNRHVSLGRGSLLRLTGAPGWPPHPAQEAGGRG